MLCSSRPQGRWQCRAAELLLVAALVACVMAVALAQPGPALQPAQPTQNVVSEVDSGVVTQVNEGNSSDVDMSNIPTSAADNQNNAIRGCVLDPGTAFDQQHDCGSSNGSSSASLTTLMASCVMTVMQATGAKHGARASHRHKGRFPGGAPCFLPCTLLNACQS